MRIVIVCGSGKLLITRRPGWRSGIKAVWLCGNARSKVAKGFPAAISVCNNSGSSTSWSDRGKRTVPHRPSAAQSRTNRLPIQTLIELKRGHLQTGRSSKRPNPCTNLLTRMASTSKSSATASALSPSPSSARICATEIRVPLTTGIPPHFAGLSSMQSPKFPTSELRAFHQPLFPREDQAELFRLNLA